MSYTVATPTITPEFKIGERNLFVTDNNTKVVIALKQNNSPAAWRSTDAGQTWTEHLPFTELSGTYHHISGALAPNGIIHVFSFFVQTSPALYFWIYNTFNPATGSWTAEETVTTSSFGTIDYMHHDIAVDDDNFPHIVYMDVSLSRTGAVYTIIYRHKRSGSWSSGVSVATQAWWPRITIAKPIVDISPVRPIVAYGRHRSAFPNTYNELQVSYGNALAATSFISSGVIETFYVNPGPGLPPNGTRDHISILNAKNQTYVHLAIQAEVGVGVVTHYQNDPWNSWSGALVDDSTIGARMSMTEANDNLYILRQLSPGVKLSSRIGYGCSWGTENLITATNANVRASWPGRRREHHLELAFRDDDKFKYAKFPLKGARRELGENFSGRSLGGTALR